MLCHQLAKQKSGGRLVESLVSKEGEGKQDLLNRIRQDGKRGVRQCNSL
jgi:hypothetical protein